MIFLRFPAFFLFSSFSYLFSNSSIPIFYLGSFCLCLCLCLCIQFCLCICLCILLCLCFCHCTWPSLSLSLLIIVNFSLYTLYRPSCLVFLCFSFFPFTTRVLKQSYINTFSIFFSSSRHTLTSIVQSLNTAFGRKFFISVCHVWVSDTKIKEYWNTVKILTKKERKVWGIKILGKEREEVRERTRQVDSLTEKCLKNKLPRIFTFFDVLFITVLKFWIGNFVFGFWCERFLIQTELSNKKLFSTRFFKQKALFNAKQGFRYNIYFKKTITQCTKFFER